MLCASLQHGTRSCSTPAKRRGAGGPYVKSTRNESTHHVQSFETQSDPYGTRAQHGEARGQARWPRIIGILGGLGPHAHIELERCLLQAVGQPAHEQDYPEWFLASLPATPDRTSALLGEGPSPVGALVAGLRRLEPLVDFAVVACHTAHAFLGEAQSQVGLPVLSLVAQVASTLDDALHPSTLAPGARHANAKVGLLATTGTLSAHLYPTAAHRGGHALEFISLLDLPDGARLQEELVMRPIYGRKTHQGRSGGGIKSGLSTDPESQRQHADVLREAAARLVAAGATCILPACTEISLALRSGSIQEVPIFEPLQILAAAALDVASGRRPLPRPLLNEACSAPVAAREEASPAYIGTSMAS